MTALILILFLLLATPASAAIAVGGHTAAAGNCSGGTTLTTSAITTAASGSTFWVGVSTTSVYTATAVDDNKSNSYTQIGTEVTTSTGLKMRRYKCVNCSGGTSHTFSVYDDGTGTECKAIWVIEITGADTTASLDQQNAAEDTASPFDSPSVTTTQANELLIGLAADDSTSDGDTFTAGASFTKLDEITTGTTTITGMSATRSVTSTGSYNFTASSVQATKMFVSIDTFKEAGGGGGGTTVKTLGLLGVGK